MAQRILIVDDEPAILETVGYALRRDGFLTVTASSRDEAARAAPDADLIVLDLMLPDGSGFDLIRSLRHHGGATPVIVLSSRDSEADRVAALETGADDYVTKPFSPREIVARVRAVLRRAAPPAAPHRPPLEAAAPALSVDEATRRAQVSGAALELTRVEFALLSSLLETPGRVYTRAQLIDRVWGDGFAITDRTVDSHVKALRKKVAEAGGDPGLIETVRGVGYRVTDEPASDDP
ncbi:MAG: response regulator transcription factor [Sorangiineae bacterium]|nr:response regulator transcription factor [Polyangiaceae bacterium]MEB2325063.1 response regulator transcription factor [Sorangiineae bacterium]